MLLEVMEPHWVAAARSGRLGGVSGLGTSWKGKRRSWPRCQPVWPDLGHHLVAASARGERALYTPFTMFRGLKIVVSQGFASAKCMNLNFCKARALHLWILSFARFGKYGLRFR